MVAIRSSFERVVAGDAREELRQLLLVRIREFREQLQKSKIVGKMASTASTGALQKNTLHN
jgi:hypothetical protein